MEHDFDERGICTRCGCSASFAEYFGGACEAPSGREIEAHSLEPDAPEPAERLVDYVLVDPLQRPQATDYIPPGNEAWLDVDAPNFQHPSLVETRVPLPLEEASAQEWWGSSRCLWPGCSHWIAVGQRWCPNCGRRQGLLGRLLLTFFPGHSGFVDVQALRSQELQAKTEYDVLKARAAQLSQTSTLVAEDLRRKEAQDRLQRALGTGEQAIRASVSRARGRLWSIAAIRWYNRLQAVTQGLAEGAHPPTKDRWTVCYSYLLRRRAQGDRLVELWQHDPEAQSADNRLACGVVAGMVESLDHLIEKLLTERTTGALGPLSGYTSTAAELDESVAEIGVAAEVGRMTELGEESVRLSQEVFRLTAELEAERLATAP